MSGPSIQELLGLPSDVTHPNAYQLFGLELGESDQAKIEDAINQKIASLKQTKSKAESETWKRAAAAVVAAQRTLKDPQAKAELDASFGIIHEPAESEAPISSPVAADPLANLLPPSANASSPAPLMPAERTSAQPSPAISTASSQLAPNNPPPASPVNPAPTSPVLGSSPPVVRRRTPVRRRRSWGGLIFGTLVLGLLAAIVGGLGYFYLLGPGNVAIVKTNDGYIINTGGPRNNGPMVSPPREPSVTPPAPQSDGVMMTPPPIRGNRTDSLNNDMRSGDTNMTADGAGMTAGNPMAADSPMSGTMSPDNQPPPTNVPTNPPTSPDPAPTPSPPPKTTGKPTPESISIGQVAIDKAREAIRTADWDLMKPLAEMAESAAVTPEQKQLAQTIYQYADLATFYRGAVVRAVPSLPFGEEIQITKTMKAMVHEADEKHLTINRGKDGSGKPQLNTFPIDQMPLIMAHALAPYQLDIDSPEGQAAKATYQAIGPFTTAGRRNESIEILRGLDKVEGADPQRLADFLASLGG